jgi:glutamate 5-kinase
MATKLNAAKLCLSKGTEMVIANGAKPSVLYDIVDGKKIGTRFRCE